MKRSILSAAVAAVAAVGLAPAAHADQKLGNYEVLSDRWANGGPSWIWAFYPCDAGNPGGPEKPLDCAVGNQFSFTSDVPDGLRCLGQNLPTRDTYTWDANTLAGVVESRYDVGCFNGPPGMNTWTFALQRY